MIAFGGFVYGVCAIFEKTFEREKKHHFRWICSSASICTLAHTFVFIKCSICISCALNSAKREKNANINKASNESIIKKVQTNVELE